MEMMSFHAAADGYPCELTSCRAAGESALGKSRDKIGESRRSEGCCASRAGTGIALPTFFCVVEPAMLFHGGAIFESGAGTGVAEFLSK